MAVALQPEYRGDTESVDKTLDVALENLATVAEDEEAASKARSSLLAEIIAGRGYHSGTVSKRLQEKEIRTYIAEPKRGRRRWSKRRDEQEPTYANRRRIRGNRGRALMRLRGEKLERSFAHVYNTGGMRRTHLQGHQNIFKRLLIHAGAFNLGLVMRKALRAGTPRGFFARLLAVVWPQDFSRASSISSTGCLPLAPVADGFWPASRPLRTTGSCWLRDEGFCHGLLALLAVGVAYLVGAPQIRRHLTERSHSEGVCIAPMPTRPAGTVPEESRL